LICVDLSLHRRHRAPLTAVPSLSLSLVACGSLSASMHPYATSVCVAGLKNACRSRTDDEMCDAWLLLTHHGPDGARAHTGYAYGSMAACVQPVKALKHPTASPCSTAALNTPHRQRREARAHDVLRLADIRPPRERPRGDTAANSDAPTPTPTPTITTTTCYYRFCMVWVRLRPKETKPQMSVER